MKTQKRPADGLAIRYAKSDAVGDETVLLLNPWPESLGNSPRMEADAQRVALATRLCEC